MISISDSTNTIYLFKNYHVVLTNNEELTKYTSDDLIGYFQSLKNSSNYINIVNELMQYGYIIDPRFVMDNDVYNFIIHNVLPDIKANYNSTFYQSWNDLIEKSDYELFIDQCLHYLSTYGTNYNGKYVYVPNSNPTELNSVLDKYTVIKFKTVAEQAQEFLQILLTPVALSDDNLNCMLSIIKNYFDNAFANGLSIKDICFYINHIKNREAKIALAKIYSVPLTEPSDMVRLISYIVTNKSNIVLNKEYLNIFHYQLINNSIVRDMLDKLFKNMSDDELKTLSQVYHRYHKMFELIHKCSSNKYNRSVINKLSRYAKKYHKPTVVGYWENLLSKDSCTKFINEHVGCEYPSYALYDKMVEDTKSGKFSCFKAVKLYNAVSERLNKLKYSFYYIRNNKMFIKDTKEISDETRLKVYGYIKDACLYYVIKHFRDYLINNNIKYIIMPDNADIVYAIPTSEKNFIGSVPMFSYLNLLKDTHNMVGIYWRNEWGTFDFDISAISSKCEKIGWNTAYRDGEHKILFSGDMTDADPEATEIIYFNNTYPEDSWFFCNRYKGVQGSKFRLFFSQEHAGENFAKNYMVDPKNVLFSVDMKSEMIQQALGCIVDKKFVFTNISVGNNRVSEATDWSLSALDYIKGAINSKLNFNMLFKFIDDICKVVTDSEYELIKKSEEAEGKINSDVVNNNNIIDLNFSNLTKDTFIRMFS